MNLHYREIGQGSPLLILHGLFGSSDNWVTLGKQLSNQFRVFLIDLRNHGQSPHSELWNYKLMAEDIEDFCIQHQLNDIYIAGHSMGGKTVMKLAELFPNRIIKMMIIDIAPKYYPAHHQNIIAALKSIDFELINTRKQAEEELQKTIDDFGTRQFLLKNIYWITENKLAWRFNLDVIAQHIEIVGEATPMDKNLICNTPACFIRGEKSNYIHNDDVKSILEQYPNTKMVTISNAGHWVHAENPQALLREMQIFFANQN